MSAFKNAKKRVIAFVVGIVLTAAGLIMLYLDFFGKKKQWYADTSYYSIAAFFIGLGCLSIAFEKKKKEGDNIDDPKDKASIG